jgi:nucleoside-diphosphate-sugar epimerase
MKRILITGADGFTGRYLANEFSRSGYEVHGLVRHAIDEQLSGVKALHVADLSDEAALEDTVRRVQPHMVAHLAGIAFVPHGDVQAIYQTNLIGTRNLLEALVRGQAPLDAGRLGGRGKVYGNGAGGVMVA